MASVMGTRLLRWQSRGVDIARELQWQGYRALSYLGFPGLTGLLLLSVAIWLSVVSVPRANVEMSRMETELASLRRRSEPIAVTVSETPLEQITKQLDPQASFTAVVDDLNALVVANRVTLVEATLGLPVVKKELPTIGQIEMVVYLRGPYASIKTSVGQLIERHPGLGLEQILLERNEGTSNVLDGHLRFAYFFRNV